MKSLYTRSYASRCIITDRIDNLTDELRAYFDWPFRDHLRMKLRTPRDGWQRRRLLATTTEQIMHAMRVKKEYWNDGLD